MKKKTIVIGVPCFNEEENVLPCFHALARVTKPFDRTYIFHFMFVDNGSGDRTRSVIRTLAKKERRVTGVFLTRNFGPEASGEAAMAYAKGDAFVYYPCDMQDPEALIPEFIRKWEAGYDTVVGVYTKTKDPWVVAQVRKLFYTILKAMADIDVPVNAGVFCLMDRKVLDALKLFPERFRFFRGLRAWVGFKTAYITYERRKRERGVSSYNVYRYIKHAERSFLGLSYLPLDAIIYAGVFLVVCSFIFLVLYIFGIVFFHFRLSEGVAILTGMVLFGGIQLLALSMIGKYVQVIVEETKSRPMYIVEEVV